MRPFTADKARHAARACVEGRRAEAVGSLRRCGFCSIFFRGDVSGVAGGGGGGACSPLQHSLPCEVPMLLTQERYQLLLEAIDMATAIDELAALRKEIRLAYASDERVRYLDGLIDQKAAILMDEVGIDEGDR